MQISQLLPITGLMAMNPNMLHCHPLPSVRIFQAGLGHTEKHNIHMSFNSLTKTCPGKSYVLKMNVKIRCSRDTSEGLSLKTPATWIEQSPIEDENG